MHSPLDWSDLASAPRDGTRILLTDGQHIAVGYLAFRIENEWKYRGYVDGEITPEFLERIPNPDAGKRHEWWQKFGCTGFDESVDVFDYDGPVYFEPTHWMPLIRPTLKRAS